jgi:hypothetical protein
MTTTTRKRRITSTAAAILAVLATVLAVGASTAAAAPAETSRATSTCWKDVVNDWLQNQPDVKGTYPHACYTQAIQHLNAYPDIQQYSNAIEDIHRAELAALRSGGNGNGPSSGKGSGGPGGGKGGGKNSGGGSSSSSSQGFFSRIFADVRPGSAQSVPLPLIVLACLAALLLLAAAGTWFARRVQARRVAPAPARPERR